MIPGLPLAYTVRLCSRGPGTWSRPGQPELQLVGSWAASHLASTPGGMAGSEGTEGIITGCLQFLY